MHLLRHLLFRTMKSSHVSVEQSSCMQVLEDFLRNQIRSMDDVRRLKQREYDGSGDMPSSSYSALFGNLNRFTGTDALAPGSVRLTNFFELAFEHMQSSMSQKMLRKSLTNGARKMLDAANREVAEICKVGLRASRRDSGRVGGARRGRGGFMGGRGRGGAPARSGRAKRKK